MKVVTYIFFRFVEYYKSENNLQRQKIYAFIAIGALIMFNLMTIKNVIDVLFNLNIAAFGLVENPYINRFAIIPLLISPIFITLWLVYLNHKNRIEDYLKEFKKMPVTVKSKLDKIFWFYVINTCIFFILSIISPMFIRH